jgi:hypothetical protein
MSLILASYGSKAQFYIGLEAGGNQNYLITNISNLVSAEYVPINGFNIAIPIQYKVNDWFALEAAPGFIQKNYQMQRTDFYQGIYQLTKNNYLQIPLSAKFFFGGKKLKGYLDLGGYAAYWNASHIKGSTPNLLNSPAFGTQYPTNTLYKNVFDAYTPLNYSQTYQFNTTTDNRVELGVSAGVGISYQVCRKCEVFTEFKYYDGLTDLQKNYEQEQVPKYNETGTLSIGFLYKADFHCTHKKTTKIIHNTIN